MPHGSTLLVGAALAALVSVSTTPATAQIAGGTLCHNHDSLTRTLLERYREVPVSVGIQTDGQLIQIFASGETGTWTILATRPDGVSCILSAGQHYEQRQPPAKPTAKQDGNERTS
jgi:hypothetical protein